MIIWASQRGLVAGEAMAGKDLPEMLHLVIQCLLQMLSRSATRLIESSSRGQQAVRLFEACAATPAGWIFVKTGAAFWKRYDRHRSSKNGKTNSVGFWRQRLY